MMDNAIWRKVLFFTLLKVHRWHTLIWSRYFKEFLFRGLKYDRASLLKLSKFFCLQWWATFVTTIYYSFDEATHLEKKKPTITVLCPSLPDYLLTIFFFHLWVLCKIISMPWVILYWHFCCRTILYQLINET